MKTTTNDLQAALWHNYTLALVADGWVNSEAIWQQYGWVADNPSSVSKHLINHLLKPLSQNIRVLLSHAKATPAHQTYSEPLQDCLIGFLRYPMMQAGRAMVGFSASDTARMQCLLKPDEPLERLQDDRLLRLVIKNLEEMINHFG